MSKNFEPTDELYMPPSNSGAVKPLTFAIKTDNVDKASDVPSIKEMKKSQADGAKGIGTAKQSYKEAMSSDNN
jgi:hypothetical protein